MDSKPTFFGSIYERRKQPTRDPNAHLPPRKPRKKRHPLGHRAFGQTPESREKQLANLAPLQTFPPGDPHGLTIQSALRRRNHRTAGGKHAMAPLALALHTPDHLCAKECRVPVGTERPHACNEHLMVRGATYLCPYFVNGRCGYRSETRDCFLETAAPVGPHHDEFMELTAARKEFARAMTFRSNNYSRGLRRRAMVRYFKLLRRIQPLLRGAPACRFVLELGRANNSVDMNFVDRDVFCAVVRGDLPRRGSREGRAAQVLDEALEVLRTERGDLDAIIDRLVAERFPHPPIAESIPPLRDPTAGLTF